jgi:FtsH-binding integral membrane protein
MTHRIYTCASIALFLFAYMIHYAYCTYITRNDITPNIYVFVLDGILLLLSCVSLFATLRRKSKNQTLLALAFMFFYSSTIALFIKDIKTLYDHKKLEMSMNVFIPHVIGWIILGVSICRCWHSMPSILILLFGLFIVHKSREYDITDHPGYLIMFIAWLTLIYGLKKPSSAEILVGVR